jgi:hypothetical protein
VKLSMWCMFQALWLAAVGLAGCAADPEAALLTTAAKKQETCPDVGCGDNSPLIGGILGIGIAELTNPTPLGPGAFNGQGVRIVGMTRGGTDYRLNVQGYNLRATSDMGLPSLMTTMLVGSRIELETEGGDTYFLYILDAHEDVTFWIGAPSRVWTYRLGWSTSPADEWPADVCPLVAPPHEGWGEAGVEAVFFRGERYDAEARTVIAIGDEAGDWFNIACAGSSIFKMFLNRLTEVSRDAAHPSVKWMRTAMLKMYAADYCGTGKAFTRIGKELRWQNVPAWRTLDQTRLGELDELDVPIAYEAMWTDGGALCLDTPRMADEPEDVQMWIDDINEECEPDLEPCTIKPWFPHVWNKAPRNAWVVTANPPVEP